MLEEILRHNPDIICLQVNIGIYKFKLHVFLYQSRFCRKSIILIFSAEL